MESRIKQMELLLTNAIASTERSDQNAAGISDFERQVGISDTSSMIVINDQGGFQYVGTKRAPFKIIVLTGYRFVIRILAILSARPSVGFRKGRGAKLRTPLLSSSQTRSNRLGSRKLEFAPEYSLASFAREATRTLSRKRAGIGIC